MAAVAPASASGACNGIAWTMELVEHPALEAHETAQQDGHVRAGLPETRKGDWRDEDDYYVHEAEEFTGIRFQYELRKCFFHEECSRTAWAKAERYSLSGQEELVEQGIAHVLASGKHADKSEQDIEDRLNQIVAQGKLGEYIKVEKETPAVRKAYRAWKDKEAERDAARHRRKEQQAKSASARPPTTAPPTKKAKHDGTIRPLARSVGSASASASGSRPLPELTVAEPRRLEAAAEDSTEEEDDALKLRMLGRKQDASMKQVVKAAVRNDDACKLTFRQAQILSDALQRAKLACESNQRLLRSTIEVCESHARQFASEARVISAASKILTQVINECAQEE